VGNATTAAAAGALSYDHVGRLTGLSWYGAGGGSGSGSGSGGGGAGYFEQMTWGYDSDSRVASFANAAHPSESLSYTYDHDSQLISAAASYGGYGGGYGGGSYSWDGNGDPTGKTVGKGNRLLADGTYRYEYDASGHMTRRTAISGGTYTVYTWDNRGRMASVTNYTSGGTVTQAVSLWYDAFNDLIGRTLTPYTNGQPGTPTTVRFVYDLTGSIVDVAPDPTAPGNPSVAADAGQAVLAFNGNASLTDRFLWGPAVDQILADERYTPSGSNQMPAAAGTTYFALGDNENSVRDWIVPGSLVDHIIYDSFGKVYSQSNSAYAFPFLHNGVFYDAATGLEWHSQSGTGLPGRWYIPAIQHWMSEDPSGLGAGPNPFKYCDNSPTNGADPSGQNPAAVIIIIVIAKYWFTPDTANAPGPGDQAHSSDKYSGVPGAIAAGVGAGAIYEFAKGGSQPAATAGPVDVATVAPTPTVSTAGPTLELAGAESRLDEGIAAWENEGGALGPQVSNAASGSNCANAASGNWKGPADYSCIKNPKDVVNNTKPTPRQVREMKQLNRDHNDGVLRDDVTGEPMVDSAKSQKGVTPPQNEAQVDHVVPRSRNGTRSSDNLQLRTRKNNRDKSSKDPGE
jgi:RHS repeat-associated protein